MFLFLAFFGLMVILIVSSVMVNVYLYSHGAMRKFRRVRRWHTAYIEKEMGTARKTTYRRTTMDNEMGRYGLRMLGIAGLCIVILVMVIALLFYSLH